MMELLSPAGSRAALEAAVQSGADAVYMGFGAFNARPQRQKFHRRGVRRRGGLLPSAGRAGIPDAEHSAD